MKLVRKINRGLLLTSVVLIAVIVYLVILTVSQRKSLPEIRNVCRSYMNTEISYSMLPQAYRKDKPNMPQSELDTYVQQMETDIKSFYPTEDQTYKYAVAQMKTSLKNQAKGNGVVYNYTKKIVQFKGFDFDNDTVTVTMVTDSVFDGFDTGSISKIRSSTTGQTTDTLVLQKKDGGWKVLYADLERPVKKNADKTTA